MNAPRRRSLAELVLFSEALSHLAVVSPLLGRIPFRRIQWSLGVYMAESLLTASGEERVVARRVGRAVRGAARRYPGHATCLARAICARMMLFRRRIPSTLYLGLVVGGPEMNAHAWLRVGDIVVVGEEGMMGHAIVASFA